MDITQSFYDSMADQYDKLFQDWQATTREQAALLNALFEACGFDRAARVLDCACGIGTQAIGLAALGYGVTASDISEAELAQARARAEANGVDIRFERADFRALSERFSEPFDIVIAMDNALPHMLSHEALEAAVSSIVGRVRPGAIFVASIRQHPGLRQPACEQAALFPALYPQDGKGTARLLPDLGLGRRKLQPDAIHHRGRGDPSDRQIRVRIPGHPQGRADGPAPRQRMRRSGVEVPGGDRVLSAHRDRKEGHGIAAAEEERFRQYNNAH